MFSLAHIGSHLVAEATLFLSQAPTGEGQGGGGQLLERAGNARTYQRWLRAQTGPPSLHRRKSAAHRPRNLALPFQTALNLQLLTCFCRTDAKQQVNYDPNN